MSVLTENFEELKLTSIFNITQLDLEMPVLRANFGDGYGAGILSGKSSGLRLWTISAGVLPDLDEYSINYEIDDDDFTSTRFEYFWEFYRRHLALGNKPFWFRDPRTRRRFLAEFLENQISFEAITSKLYVGGVSIKQRRVKMSGISFRSEDGSVVGDTTSPSDPEDFTLTSDSLEFTASWEPSIDPESEITEYILVLEYEN